MAHPGFREVAFGAVTVASIAIGFAMIRAVGASPPALFHIDAHSDRVQFIASGLERSTMRFERARILIGGRPFDAPSPDGTDCVTGFVTPYAGSRVALSVQNGAAVMQISPHLKRSDKDGKTFAELELETISGTDDSSGHGYTITHNMLSADGLDAWIVTADQDIDIISASDCAPKKAPKDAEPEDQSEGTNEGEAEGATEDQTEVVTGQQTEVGAGQKTEDPPNTTPAKQDETEEEKPADPNALLLQDDVSFASQYYPIHLAGYAQIGLHTPSQDVVPSDPLPAVMLRNGVQISGAVQVYSRSLLCLRGDACTFFASTKQDIVIPAVSGVSPQMKKKLRTGARIGFGDADKAIAPHPLIQGTIVYSEGLYHVQANTVADYLQLTIPYQDDGSKQVSGAIGLSPMDELMNDPHLTTVVSICLAVLSVVVSILTVWKARAEE